MKQRVRIVLEILCHAIAIVCLVVVVVADDIRIRAVFGGITVLLYLMGLRILWERIVD